MNETFRAAGDIAVPDCRECATRPCGELCTARAASATVADRRSSSYHTWLPSDVLARELVPAMHSLRPVVGLRWSCTTRTSPPFAEIRIPRPPRRVPNSHDGRGARSVQNHTSRELARPRTAEQCAQCSFKPLETGVNTLVQRSSLETRTYDLKSMIQPHARGRCVRSIARATVPERDRE